MNLRSVCLLLALAGAVFGTTASAADVAIPVGPDGQPQWVPAVFIDFPVRLVLQDREQLDQLLAQVPIRSFDREQIGIEYLTPKQTRIVFRPRVTDDEFAALVAAGYRPEKLRDLDREGREEAERVWAEMAAKGEPQRDTYPLNYYPNNTQIGTMLQAMQTSYPTMAQYFTIGTSLGGRPRHGIRISDNVGVNEPEAEVRLSSTIHGDEVTGMNLTINFAYYLLENYGEAGREDVTNLVDNYDIYIIPDYNPDGTALNQRGNQNGVDLNRNFPLPAGTHPVTELENLQFMDFSTPRHFVMSCNYHGGALVMNYPWDYTYALAPDNDALIRMSLEYSTYNLPMYNGDWPQGITNGAAWYVITGGLQDWTYDQTGCLDITIEISNVKWPPASQLATFWNDNRESMMHYVKCARYGVNGIVTAADTGLPLDATVTVTGISTEVHTDPECGDYYKLLPTGTYTISYSAVGYVTQTLTGVATTWGTPTVRNVQLQPLAEGLVYGTVKDDSGNGLAATVTLRTWPAGALVETVQSNAAQGGAFEISAYYGDYTITASAPDHFTESQQIAISSTPTVVTFVLGGMVTSYPVQENFEAGAGGFAGDWIVTNTAGHNSTSSMTDGVGNYANNTNKYCTMTSGVDLSDVMTPEVSFWAKWAIENNWDAVYFQISTNGGSTWTSLATQYTNNSSGQGAQAPAGVPCFDATQANWVFNSVDLTPYVGQTDVRFRFYLKSDNSQVYDGFYFDDFQVKVVTESSGSTDVDDLPAMTVAKVAAHPNPFNPQTTVAFTNPRAGHVELAVYDLQGRHVRTLVSANLAAGDHTQVWDGRGDDGQTCGSGVYFARMVAQDAAVTAKLMLVK